MSQKIIDYLENELNTRILRNPSYSIRAYARDLDVESSSLSRVLSSKREISLNFANKVLNELKVPEHTKNSLLLTLVDDKNYVERGVEKHKESISKYTESGKWYFPAVLHCLRLERLNNSIASIASYLNITPEEVEECLRVHVELGSAEYLKELDLYVAKKTEPGNKRVSIVSEKVYTEKHLRNHHKEIQEQLLTIFPKLADRGMFYSSHINIPVDKYEEAARRLHEFQAEFSNWLDQYEDESNDVCRLYIAFNTLDHKHIFKK